MDASGNDLPVLEIRISRGPENTYCIEMQIGEREFPRGTLGPDILRDEPGQDRGATLFKQFTADEPVRMAWNLAAAIHPRRRIRLRIDDLLPELHTVPWEVLHDPSPTATARTLAADRDTPFSRHVVTAWDPLGPLPALPIKLLSAVAAPTDLATYNLPAIDRALETDFITRAIAAAPPGRVEHTHLAGPCTLAALEAELEKGYHLLHLVAHGGLKRGSDGFAAFLELPDGRVDRVDSSRLAAMIERLSPTLRLAVLICCHSATRFASDARLGLAPQLLAAGVPAVVAMQDLLPVDTAHAFTGSFYKELWDSGEVDRAANRARATILTERLSGDAIPVLYSTRASNRLWLAGAPTVATQPAAAASVGPQPAAAASVGPQPAAAAPARTTAPGRPAAAASRPQPAWHPFGGPFNDVELVRLQGGVLVFAVDPDNKLWLRVLDNTDGTWTGWSEVCDDVVSIRALVDDDNLITAFARDSAGAVWVRREISDGEYGPWTSLGGTWVEHEVTRFDDGRLAVFAIDEHHAIHLAFQEEVDGDWQPWEDFGRRADQLTILRDLEGSLELFALDRSKVFHTYEEDDEDNPWVEWYDFTGRARYLCGVVARDGSAHLFAVGTQGGLWRSWRTSDGNWGDWENLGGDPIDIAAVAVDGAIHVFTVGEDHVVWQRIFQGEDKPRGPFRLGAQGRCVVLATRNVGTDFTLITIDDDDKLSIYSVNPPG